MGKFLQSPQLSKTDAIYLVTDECQMAELTQKLEMGKTVVRNLRAAQIQAAEAMQYPYLGNSLVRDVVIYQGEILKCRQFLGVWEADTGDLVVAKQEALEAFQRLEAREAHVRHGGLLDLQFPQSNQAFDVPQGRIRDASPVEGKRHTGLTGKVSQCLKAGLDCIGSSRRILKVTIVTGPEFDIE